MRTQMITTHWRNYGNCGVSGQESLSLGRRAWARANLDQRLQFSTQNPPTQNKRRRNRQWRRACLFLNQTHGGREPARTVRSTTSRMQTSAPCAPSRSELEGMLDFWALSTYPSRDKLSDTADCGVGDGRQAVAHQSEAVPGFWVRRLIYELPLRQTAQASA